MSAPATLGVRSTQVTGEIGELARITQTLHERVANLRDKLSPVLRQEEGCPTATAKEQRPEPNTPVGTQLREVFEKQESTLSMIDDVTQRLEV